MSQPRSLSPVDLRVVLNRFFDGEELRTLCFDLRVDYDGLRGEGKAAKARELVSRMQRLGRMRELEAAVRRERPALDTIYSLERVQELQESILTASQPDVQNAFIEFTQQIEAYLNEFNLLHEQLQEWKEVHNLLQDMQNNFAPCRGYIYALGRIQGSARPPKADYERILYEVEVEWRPCKRVLFRLEELAASIVATGNPYDPDTGTGPDWYMKTKAIAGKIDRALFEGDGPSLTESLSSFGNRVDQYLYLADKTLRDVVAKINQLPRPQPIVSL